MMMNMMDKKILIFGTGISGISAAKLLESTTNNIIMYEGNNTLDIPQLKAKLGDDFRGRILYGDLTDELIESLDLVVLSPGVPTDLELVNKMRDSNIPIIGEIELAYHFAKGRIACITGTNGKTTTTTLVGQILNSYYESVFVVGNIGLPYTSTALMTTEKSVTVAELSSFQLETIRDFNPDVSAILNITPDHLNRHHTMENYINAKVNITLNQGENQVCILNYEDEVLRKVGDKLNTKIFYFSSMRSLENGIYLENDNIIYRKENEEIFICNVNELNIFGRHSYENVMAAVAIALSLNVPLINIQTTIKKFIAVEHRIEYVTTKNGVKYYNDSKGTNPDASMKAIESMQTPTVLIAGGYDKNSDYDEWVGTFGNKIKCLVLLGQTKDKIKETALKHGFTNIVIVDSLEEAVKVCSKTASNGECVLLSPACASWGMFKDYEERGRLFKQYVNEL
jgi:UDP-N-acetylmuramoylalanine--D-glutamate ligase